MAILVETWVWYTFAMLVVIGRYVSRYLLLGSIRKYAWEDYIMLTVVVMYTVLISLLNVVMSVSTNLMLPEDIPKLTPESIAARVQGSKLVIVTEQMMLGTIWLCKACLLLMYHKMTMGLKANLACKIVGAYVAVTFIVMDSLYFGFWCRPFRGAWEVPTPNEQCATQTHHLLVNLVFNLTTDVLILSIPLPLLIRSKLPLHRKLVLVCLFSLGSFVMLSAVLSKVFSFRDPFSADWIFWYTREASTAVIVTNMPHCWALLRRAFRLKSFMGHDSTGRGNTYSGKPRGYGVGSSHHTASRGNAITSHISRAETPSGHRSFFSDKKRSYHLPLHSRSDSQERIAPLASANATLEIWQETQFHVSHSTNTNPDRPEGQDHFTFGTSTDAVALKDLAKASVESISSTSSTTDLDKPLPELSSQTLKSQQQKGSALSRSNSIRDQLPIQGVREMPSINVTPPSRAARSPPRLPSDLGDNGGRRGRGRQSPPGTQKN